MSTLPDKPAITIVPNHSNQSEKLEKFNKISHHSKISSKKKRRKEAVTKVSFQVAR